MPRMDWVRHEGQIFWYKTCCTCKTEFWVEVEDSVLAREIMKQHFPLFNGRSGNADGFNSQCHSCNNNRSTGRKYNGIHREEMLKTQGGKCAIKSCKKEISFKHKNAYVDHDHVTSQIRAILCCRCNTMMAGVDDDKWLAAAMAYRKAYRC